MQNEKKERGREVRQRKRKNCTQCGVPSRIIPRKVKPSGWSKRVLLNYDHPLPRTRTQQKIFFVWGCVNVKWERKTSTSCKKRRPKCPHFSFYFVIKKYWDQIRRDISLINGACVTHCDLWTFVIHLSFFVFLWIFKNHSIGLSFSQCTLN